MRRATAFVLLVLTLAGQAESVVGEVRDAEVHHETTLEAFVHTQDPHGAHAHDALPEQPDHQARGEELAGDHSDHEHGTCADHCTHVHGTALTGQVDLQLVVAAWVIPELSSPTIPIDLPFATLSPPPRP